MKWSTYSACRGKVYARCFSQDLALTTVQKQHLLNVIHAYWLHMRFLTSSLDSNLLSGDRMIIWEASSRSLRILSIQSSLYWFPIKCRTECSQNSPPRLGRFIFRPACLGSSPGWFSSCWSSSFQADPRSRAQPRGSHPSALCSQPLQPTQTQYCVQRIQSLTWYLCLRVSSQLV